MTKLCPRGKAAAKRKFRVYPSAYANAYASRICAGKIKDPSGVKRKDFRGRKPAAEGGPINKMVAVERRTVLGKPRKDKIDKKPVLKPQPRKKMMGGGLMEATARLKRQGLKKGGVASEAKKKQFKTNQAKQKETTKKVLKAMVGPFNPVSAGQNVAKKIKERMGKKMGGGMMRPMYGKGGGVCLRGMNREAVGKNS
jgi:hypothetical protein